MALTNLTSELLQNLFKLTSPLDSEAYLVVDNISHPLHYKEDVHLFFDALIYTDKNKTDLIVSKQFNISSEFEIREIKGRVNTLPVEAKLGDLYLISNNYLPYIHDAWLLAQRKVPENDNSFLDGWGFWRISPYESFLFGSKYYKISSATSELTEVVKPTKETLLWQIFLKNKDSRKDYTIVEKCYNFLKNLPAFADTIDC